MDKIANRLGNTHVIVPGLNLISLFYVILTGTLLILGQVWGQTFLLLIASVAAFGAGYTFGWYVPDDEDPEDEPDDEDPYKLAA